MKGLNEMDMDMDIMEIVDMMEEAIEKASAVPLTGKVMIDELKEAKWVKEERQRILSEAENRAEAIQKNAEETQMQLIDEHEITKAAYEQANELVNAAQQKSIEIKTDTDQYVDDVLNDVEHRLDLLLRKVREDRGYFNNN